MKFAMSSRKRKGMGCCRWLFEEKATKLQVDYALRRISDLERKVLEISRGQKKKALLKPLSKRHFSKTISRLENEAMVELPCGCVLKKKSADETSEISIQSDEREEETCECGLEICNDFDQNVNEDKFGPIYRCVPKEENPISRQTKMTKTEQKADDPENGFDSRNTKTGPNRRLDADFHCMPVPLAAYGKERALKRHYECNPLRYKLPERAVDHVGENVKMTDVVAIPKKKKTKKRPSSRRY